MEATKKESEVRTGELTQALASVTVGKTKVGVVECKMGVAMSLPW